MRDTTGALLADLPRVRVTYRLPNLLAGQVLLSSVTLDHPTHPAHQAPQRPDELRGGARPQEGAGRRRVAPDRFPRGEGRPAARSASRCRGIPTARSGPRPSATPRSAAERAKPGRVIEEGYDGLRRVILLSDLNARFARLRITTPDRKPFTVDIDSLATRVSDPAVTLRDAVGRVRLHADSADLQPLPRLAARYPVLGRRRRHLAARHDAVRLPGHLATREPGRPALGLARLPGDDRQRRARGQVGDRRPDRLRHPRPAPPERRPADRRLTSSRSPTGSAGSASAT